MHGQLKRYVNGELGGFELDEMRCWEFDVGHTDVTFKSGVTVRFRGDLREKIMAAQALPAFAYGWGTGGYNIQAPLGGTPTIPFGTNCP